MKRTQLGIVLGVIIGIIDIIPMIFQKMPCDANFSAFFHWVILGYLISITNVNLKGYIKGLLLAVITMIPIAFLVWWNNYAAIIPMTVSTLVFGLLLGFLIEKYGE